MRFDSDGFEQQEVHRCVTAGGRTEGVIMITARGKTCTATEYRMNTATAVTRNLFSLYDYIQNGDTDSLRRHLRTCSTEINTVLPCKGVGILHLAAGIEPLNNSVECTEIILKHGGDPNLCSEDGMTPVHIAAIWGRLGNLRLLVACGGDPTLRDDDGRTAYDYAVQEQQWPVYDYLCRTFDKNERRRNMEAEVKRMENVEELDGDRCDYSLQLDRVFVSTGHVVAEYGTVSEDRLQDVSVCRKSEMVREWCEQTSHVNRLYPTILNQTYHIQDECEPWKPGEISQKVNVSNLQDDNNKSLSDTKTSYKSCFSKKLSPEELGISGIQVLHETITEEDPNCDCLCHEMRSKPDVCSRRVSVYENFSLPGSPTNITHQNYKSKTSLRKNKSNISKNYSNSSNLPPRNASSGKNKFMNVDKSKPETLDGSGPATTDTDGFHYVDYRHLNDAVAMVQNDTNEWLSQSNSSNDSDDHLTRDVIVLDDSDENLTTDMDGQAHELTMAERSLIKADGDTRRASQKSSGVNSTVSSGSIAIASVQEEYKYEDKEEDVVLIEKRLLIPSVVLSVDEAAADDVSPEESRHSMASSLPASIDYDARCLRAELTARGFNPGPINNTTKRLYLRKLKNLKKNPIVVRTSQGRTYSVELEKSLRNENWFEDLTPYIELEGKVRSDFANTKNARSWREGTAKTSFTYLLLDPRTTNNLPVRAGGQTRHATWTTFVNSIFYVGKGKRSRPYSHLYQALTLWKRDFKTSSDKKVQHILDIWSDQVGVICLHVFQNVIPAEAYTYEASMIDVLGVAGLKNLKSGNYYGVAAGWPVRDRRMLGLYLLYKAMLIFLSEGERQLRPGDID